MSYSSTPGLRTASKVIVDADLVKPMVSFEVLAQMVTPFEPPLASCTATRKGALVGVGCCQCQAVQVAIQRVRSGKGIAAPAAQFIPFDAPAAGRVCGHQLEGWGVGESGWLVDLEQGWMTCDVFPQMWVSKKKNTHQTSPQRA